jgi:hypothetical protein
MAAAIILLVLPMMATTASAWAIPRLLIPRQMIKSERNGNSDVRQMGSRAPYSYSSYSQSSQSPSRSTQLTVLAMDPADAVVSAASQYDHHAYASALDALSSITLAKATTAAAAAMGLPPNQSVAPLSETIRSAIEGVVAGGGGGGVNVIEVVIPDMPAMPGGAPRSGNPFLAGSFREMYDAAVQPPNPRMLDYNGMRNDDGSVSVPARELDVVARYADLLGRIPLAAAIYALVDFFLINAEEDVAISELLSYEGGENDDDDYDYDEDGGYGSGNDVEAIMDVENRVLIQRIVGLLAIVFVTIAWSLVSYHPVPFNEL